MLRGLETMEGQASFIAEWEALGDWRIGVEYMEQIRKTRKEDIVRVCKRYLGVERVSVLTYRSKTAEPLVLTLEDLQYGK
jgi:hypothetical protein